MDLRHAGKDTFVSYGRSAGGRGHLRVAGKVAGTPRRRAPDRTRSAAPGRYAASMDRDYTPEQVADLRANSKIQLIDVREPHEHAVGRIAGDVHIELDELSARAAEIDRDVPVVFYCRSGSRSAMATQAFAAAGYDAHNMAGGLLAWHGHGLPLEPPGGFVGEP